MGRGHTIKQLAQGITRSLHATAWDQFNRGTFSTLLYLVPYKIIDFDFCVFGSRISAESALWDFVQLLPMLAKKSKVFCFERNILISECAVKV